MKPLLSGCDWVSGFTMQRMDPVRATESNVGAVLL